MRNTTNHQPIQQLNSDTLKLQWGIPFFLYGYCNVSQLMHAQRGSARPHSEGKKRFLLLSLQHCTKHTRVSQEVGRCYYTHFFPWSHMLFCVAYSMYRSFRTLSLKVPSKNLQAHCLELKCHFRLSICVVVSEKSYLLY